MTDCPNLLKRLLVLSAATGLVLTPVATRAQVRNPDVLSAYIGMPANLARMTLQKRLPQALLLSDPSGYTLSVTDPMNPEVVRIYVTMEPNEPAVWLIQRTQNCNGPPPSPNQLEQICLRSFFAVTAMVNDGPQGLLQAYTIELVNLPYALRAATITGNAKNAEAEKAKQDLINKGTRKPAL